MNVKTLQFIVVMNNEDKGTEKDVFNFSDVQAKGLDFGKDHPNYFKRVLNSLKRMSFAQLFILRYDRCT